MNCCDVVFHLHLYDAPVSITIRGDMSGSTPATSSKVEEKPPPQATPAAITLEINPSRRQRLITTLTFPLLILLAIPFWWYVTSIQRLPLPTARISALETATVPLCRLTVLRDC